MYFPSTPWRQCRFFGVILSPNRYANFQSAFLRKIPTLTVASFFSSVQSVTSTFCALMQLMHIYQLLPYVLSTSFSKHPKRLTWDKKPFQNRIVHFLWHYETFLLFSALWDWFFPKFLLIVPPINFWFCNRLDVQKIPKRPPFYIFRHYATYRKLWKKNKKGIFFSVFSFLRAFVVSSCRKSLRVFLSLRYGADLGRSRLVSSCRSERLSVPQYVFGVLVSTLGGYGVFGSA